MARLRLLPCLLQLVLLTQVSAVSSVLRASRAHAKTDVQGQAQLSSAQALRVHTATLGKAIWDELGMVDTDPLTPHLSQARDLLVHEANYLAAEDYLAGALLRKLARQAMVPVLTMQAPQVVVPRSLQYPGEVEAVESTETTLQRDTQGRTVRTARHCREGQCVTVREVVPSEEPEHLEVERAAPIAVESLYQRPEDKELALRSSVEEAAQHVQRVFQEMMEDELMYEEDAKPDPAKESASKQEAPASIQLDQALDSQELQDFQDWAEGLEETAEEEDAEDEEEEEALSEEYEAFEEPAADPRGFSSSGVAAAADAAGSPVRESSRALARSMVDFVHSYGPLALGGLVRDLAQEQAQQSTGGTSAPSPHNSMIWEDMLRALFPGGVSRAAGGAEASPGLPSTATQASESLSVVQAVENGRLVQRTRHCLDGTCKTTAMNVTELEDPAPLGGQGGQAEQ